MPNDLFNLKHKTALITGGARGLGLAIANGLAQHGADVAIVSRDEEHLQKARRQIETQAGRRAWGFIFDLQQADQLDKFFTDLIRSTSGIDILVNCAGITYRSPAESFSLEKWNEIIQINLTTVFRLSQCFCQHCKDMDKPGKIINMGSLNCKMARPSIAPYAASKGGLLMLTRALALEWAKYHINVNAIGPGYFETELTKPLKEDAKFDQWVKSKTPMKRWGQPQDLVGTSVFLASGASDFVTGQILYVDGGWMTGL